MKQNNLNPNKKILVTGRGYSVLEMLKAFEKASEVKIAYEIVDRRESKNPKGYDTD